jgi:hypothetical protein
MKWVSPLIADARNKLGGTVYARNAFGVYARPLIQPRQPRTALQQANRTAWGGLTKQWPALSQSQRDTWLEVAESTTLTDSLGHQFRPSGIGLYVANNRNLALIGLPPTPVVTALQPAFPSTAPTAFLLEPSGSSSAAWRVNVPTNVAPLRANLVWQSPAPQPPQIGFVGPALYRNMFPLTPSSAFTVQADIPFYNLFGLPTVGYYGWIKLSLVDPVNGWRSVPSVSRSIVT